MAISVGSRFGFNTRTLLSIQMSRKYWSVTDPLIRFYCHVSSERANTREQQPQPCISFSPEVCVAFVLQLSGDCYPHKAKISKQAYFNGFSCWFGVSFLTSSFPQRYTLKHHEIEWMCCSILLGEVVYFRRSSSNWIIVRRM